jgi:hypothetical protein
MALPETCVECGTIHKEGERHACAPFVEFDERSDTRRCIECGTLFSVYDGHTCAPLPGMKASNPKQAFGDKKAPLSTVSAPVMYELGLAMLEGALKYGKHNYRAVGVRYSTYFDAALRHMMAWWEGEDIDPDSGLHHLVKCMACCAVMRDSIILGNANDDRPPRPPADWLRELNARAEALVKKYPEPKTPITHVDMSWAKAATEK